MLGMCGKKGIKETQLLSGLIEENDMRIIVDMITIIVLLVCVALNIGAIVYEHKTIYPNKKALQNIYWYTYLIVLVDLGIMWGMQIGSHF